MGSVLYASLRFAEAYGLWRDKAWAEWLAAISGAIYIPFEVVELIKKVTALRIVSLAVNLLIVGYMLSMLRKHREKRGHEDRAQGARRGRPPEAPTARPRCGSR